MNDSVRVRERKRARNVAEYGDRITGAGRSFTTQMNRERLTVNERHDEVRYAFDFSCLQDANDVRMLELRNSEYLAAEPAR